MSFLKQFIRLFAAILLAFMPIFHVQHTTTANTENLFDNPSTEFLDNGTPRSWSTGKWGVNEAVFTHSNSAYSGSKSVRTEVVSYTSGDAKWYPASVDVEPGTTYTFSEQYRSNTATQVVLRQTDSDGLYSYKLLQTVPAAADWAYIEHIIDIPYGIEQVSVFHVVSSVGWLEVDDFSLKQVPSTNLVKNPSLEFDTVENPVYPDGWLSNAWGDNDGVFEYVDDAYDGVKAAKTTLFSRTSGDAKWYFEDVTVDPSKTYRYQHAFKSDVNTRVVARYAASDGTFSYEPLASLSPASDWVLFDTFLQPPSQTVSLTVFHIIEDVGYITIDSVVLEEFIEEFSPNPIANSSVEIADGTTPEQWYPNTWGSHAATFDYVNEGRTGDKSIRVAVDDYVSGDAKWYFDDVSLVPGQGYELSLWYKTDTIPRSVMRFTRDNGSVFYESLAVPQPGSDSQTVWQEYSDVFTMPTDAVSATVFFQINGNGWIQTDDYLLSEYVPEGFNRPLVSLTFDDGQEINTSTALPIMQSYGFASTQCYATSYIENTDDEQAAVQSVLQFRDAGHELCSHTVTHPFLSQLSEQQAEYELSHSQEYLQSITGQSIQNFASPYGDYDGTVIGIIDDYYRSHRTVNAGYNSKDNFALYRIKTQNITPAITIEEFQGWLDYAAATNTWLVLVYHRVADDPGPFDAYISDFAEQMQVLADSGIDVKTYNEALDELLPQL